MTTKLTLSLDPKVIDRAKKIARKRGKSLSKMVEEFFTSIPEKEGSKESLAEQIEKRMSPYIDEHTIPEDSNYRELAREWKYRDYLEQKNLSE